MEFAETLSNDAIVSKDLRPGFFFFTFSFASFLFVTVVVVVVVVVAGVVAASEWRSSVATGEPTQQPTTQSKKKIK